MNLITTVVDYMIMGICGFTLLGLIMRLVPELIRWGILVGIIATITLIILWDYKPARPYIICIMGCWLVSLLFIFWGF